MEIDPTLKERLTRANQDHLLDYWSELTDEQRRTLLHDINEIDLDRVARAYNGIKHELLADNEAHKQNGQNEAEQESIDDIMEPVPDDVMGSISETSEEQLQKYQQCGWSSSWLGQSF